MPVFDLKCTTCGDVRVDVFHRVHEPHPPCPKCGGVPEMAYLGSSHGVIGDEIDVWVENGLCYPDSTPRHFRSKTDLARAAKKAGLVNRVEHVGGKHTSRWV